MQKPIVFISHITEERDIALALKKLVESNFLAMMEVFVSSDPTSIPVGQKWLDRITDGLKRCAVEIIIASPISVLRPWINFEGGAGWIRNIPVIPLCHSGMTPKKLPQPLGYLQAAVASDANALQLLIPVLATALECGVPKVDFSEFIQTVRDFEETSAQLAKLPDAMPSLATGGLAGHELYTLITIAESTDSFEEGVGLWQLVKEPETSVRPIFTKLAVKSLERHGLVEIKNVSDYNHNNYTTVGITDVGWEWLQSNHANLPTTVVSKDAPKLPSSEPTSEDVPF